MPAEPYRSPKESPAGAAEPDVTRLGSLLSVHAPPPFHRVLLGPLVVTLVVGGVGILFGSLALAFAAVPAAVAGLAWFPVRLRREKVTLYARGLLVSRGNQQATLLFEDVDEVWFEIGRLHSDQGAFLRALRLVDFDGRQRRVPLVVEDALRLSKAILRGASLPLLLEARRALDRGETLTFGTTTIDRDGLSISGAAAAWKDVRLARVQPARVSFFQRRPLFPWRVVRLDRIPNPTVFAALVAQKVRNVKYDDRLMVPLGPDATD